MAKRLIIIFILFLACAAIVTASYRSSTAKPPSSESKSPPVKPPVAIAALNPLQIEAMRQRAYPGGALSISGNTLAFTADGLQEFGLISVPAGAQPVGGWPVIILCHGYIDPAQYALSANWYSAITAALTQSGYVVIKPDYRGYGQSQGQPEGGHFSPVYSYDVLNLIASLKRDHRFNAGRIGLLGHSLGGDVALHVAVISRDIKATAVMNGVVGSFYDMFYNWPGDQDLSDRPLALVQGIRQHLIDQYGTPKINPAFWDSASAINFVSAVTGPVQINQDSGDTAVPVLFSDHLVAALQSAHKAVQYYAYPGNDHLFSQPANRALLIQRLTDFYRANL